MFHQPKLLIKTVLIALTTALLAIVLASVTTGNTDLMSIRVWTAPSLEKIALDAPPGEESDIQLTAARGEIESFQIAIQALADNVQPLTVEVSDLASKNGDKISQKQITLYRQHYVYVPQGSPEAWKENPPQGAGWYPDGLIPFTDPQTGKDLEGAELDAVPFVPEVSRNQPIWVDIEVPRGAAAGEYQGTYTVKSQRGKVTGNISLKVWDFALPTTPSLKSAILFKGKKYPQLQAELLQHKMMPKWVDPALSQEYAEELGLNAVRMPYWSGGNVHTCEMKPAPPVAELKQIVDSFPSEVTRYVFSADEIHKCQNLEEPLKEWARAVRAAGAKHLIVTIPRPELYDDGSGTGRSVADIWVVKPTMYEEAPENIAEVLAKGDEVWFYTGLKGSHSPKWLLDYPPIDFRIPQGFISQSLDLTGMLYWKADYWTTEDPWTDITTHFRNNGARAYPGDGMLLYPGEKVGVAGVVPSLRMKWIRDGVEDYEYVQILKELGEREWALSMSRSIGADWKNWTKDPQELLAVRTAMGEKIQEVMQQSAASQ